MQSLVFSCFIISPSFVGVGVSGMGAPALKGRGAEIVLWNV